jgi:hypothetical protein
MSPHSWEGGGGILYWVTSIPFRLGSKWASITARKRTSHMWPESPHKLIVTEAILHVMTCKTPVLHAGSPCHTELWSCAPRWTNTACLLDAWWWWQQEFRRGWWVGLWYTLWLSMTYKYWYPGREDGNLFYLHSAPNVLMDTLHMVNKASLSAFPILGGQTTKVSLN